MTKAEKKTATKLLVEALDAIAAKQDQIQRMRMQGQPEAVMELQEEGRKYLVAYADGVQNVIEALIGDAWEEI